MRFKGMLEKCISLRGVAFAIRLVIEALPTSEVIASFRFGNDRSRGRELNLIVKSYIPRTY